MAPVAHKPKALHWHGPWEEPGRNPVPYLHIQVLARGGRRVGVGADGGAGRGGGGAWGPARGGVQWAGRRVWVQLVPQLLSLGLLARLWARLSLQG